jgi:hypothetical protein
MVLAHRLSKVRVREPCGPFVDTTAARPGTLESDLVEEFPQIGSRFGRGAPSPRMRLLLLP